MLFAKVREANCNVTTYYMTILLSILNLKLTLIHMIKINNIYQILLFGYGLKHSIP